MLLTLAAAARPRVVQQPLVDADNIGFRESFTLSDTLDDSLFMMANTVTLEETSRVTGDAAFIAETVTVNGRVDGDLTVTGGTVILGGGASVGGDLLLIGGTAALGGRVEGNLSVSGARLTIAPEAEIQGTFSACVETLTDGRERGDTLQPCNLASMTGAFEAFQPFTRGASFLSPDPVVVGLISTAFVSLALAGLATLAATVFPRQISHIEEAIRVTPRHQVITGVMTLLFIVGVGSGFIFLLAKVPAVGVVLFPVLIVGGLALLGVTLIGLVTLAIVLGEWMLGRISPAGAFPPLIAAGAGSATLSLLLHLPVFLPYGALVSVVFILLLSTVAVGAALTTRLGTRPLRQSTFVQG
mgnify:CR=1 FL=1